MKSLQQIVFPAPFGPVNTTDGNQAAGSLFDNFENYQPSILTAINVSAGADYQSQAPLALIEVATDRSHPTHTRMGINTNKLASSPGARTRLGDP
ncbi:MAG: hypothetical protein CM15mP46_5120 [Alphaproteobacteria bacterium]|nr:MAG: hypothetical protein CM15mP46_5120 [Alphaproteobacteria bacterium]